MEQKQTLMWKELSEAPAILEKLRDKNAAVLSGIAQDSKKITNIYTAARGTSDHAMLYLKYLTESTLGIPVASGAPSVVTMYGVKMNFKDSLIVACSQSGKAADVMEIVKEANAQGAVTVAITNDETSPLAKLAKYHLCCYAGEEKSVAATKTFTCQLYLAYLLVHALQGESGADTIGAFLQENLSLLDGATDDMAREFSSAQECFILSRGITAAIAFECGLKLQEACYIRARAYHSSDFYHGPMAMISEGTKVILYASSRSLSEQFDAPHREDYIKCAEKMEELGADLYIITDDRESFKDMKAKKIYVPQAGRESEQVFVFALATQMLACKVSCLKNLNPDSPRALKKVTVTL